MLVKCEFCNTRVRKNQLGAHERHCIRARRAKRSPIAELVNPEDIIISPGFQEIQLIDNGSVTPVLPSIAVSATPIPKFEEKKKRGRPKKEKK
jgi:hypothetical protein